MSRSLLFLLLSFCVCAAIAKHSSTTLVLTDSPNTKTTHSKFLDSLQDRGHKLVFRDIYEDHLALHKYGDYSYDNVILLAPTVEDFSGGLSIAQFSQFVDAGRNLMIVYDSKATEPLRELAFELGVIIDEGVTTDHFNFDKNNDDGTHTTILSSNYISNSALLGKTKGAVLFRGLSHTHITSSANIVKVLSGSSSSFTGSGRVDETNYNSPLLVSTIQTPNNARIVIAGSFDMLSDKFYTDGVANSNFCTELSKWNFGEKGVLRASNLTHFSVNPETKQPSNSELNPASYRVGDWTRFSVLLEEYDGESGSWIPLNTDDTDDIQLELVMWAPFIRTNLHNDGKGVYSTVFQVPDEYGVFKFVIDHHRVGYSNLELSHQVSVRPFRHNEYDRFLLIAYPYYMSAITMMVGFFIFGIVFLYGTDFSDKDLTKEKKA